MKRHFFVHFYSAVNNNFWSGIQNWNGNWNENPSPEQPREGFLLIGQNVTVRICGDVLCIYHALGNDVCQDISTGHNDVTRVTSVSDTPKASSRGVMKDTTAIRNLREVSFFSSRS